MIGPHVRTDFSQYTHQQLIAMLYASDPAAVRDAAAKWDAVGQYLHAQAGDLDKQLSDFDSKWSGGAAAQYHVMIQDLGRGLRTAADNAWATRDAVHDSADALDTARAEMPQPVAVPDVSPATISLATTPVTVPADASPAQVAAVQQQQQQASTAVAQQQQAQSASDAAHAKAVQVMTTLADHYTADTDRIPATPSATGTPTGSGGGALGLGSVLPDLDGSGSVPVLGADGLPLLGADGLPVSGANGLTGAGTGLAGAAAVLPYRNGIFGGMFAAGLAAASAAALGRFGAAMPRVPAFASGRGSKTSDEDGKGSATGGHAQGGTLPPLGAGGAGGGAGGLGDVSVGGAGGIDGPSDGPTAYHGMGTGTGSSLSTGLTAAAAAAPFAARAASGMGGFMPAMPMGAGMGAMGGDGGTKRIPPWLVETEDVWGETSAVSPSVIGDEPV